MKDRDKLIKAVDQKMSLAAKTLFLAAAHMN